MRLITLPGEDPALIAALPRLSSPAQLRADADAMAAEAQSGPRLPELPPRFRPWPPAGLKPWGNVPA